MLSLWDGFPQPGTVYGVILNDETSVSRLKDQFTEAPYKAAPIAPILYIKPANTWRTNQASVMLPEGEKAVEIGATLAIVIAKDTARIPATQAQEHIAGYMLAADLSLPHSSYYRPAIREKSFDGSCVFGNFLPASQVSNPASLTIETQVNNTTVNTRHLSELIRDIPTLITDISDYMTLKAGDILLVGVQYQAPQANAGDTVSLQASSLGNVAFTINPFQGGAQ